MPKFPNLNWDIFEKCINSPSPPPSQKLFQNSLIKLFKEGVKNGPSSSSQSSLQAQIRIAEHYGKRYRIRYGAEKTKITIVGSEIDMQYYQDTTPWTMGGECVKVVENNEHLGQVVSGIRQEAKNIDLRIQKGRNNLYSLLGPAFAYKCMLSPQVTMHIFRTFTCPIIRYGLSSSALRAQ